MSLAVNSSAVKNIHLSLAVKTSAVYKLTLESRCQVFYDLQTYTGTESEETDRRTYSVSSVLWNDCLVCCGRCWFCGWLLGGTAARRHQSGEADALRHAASLAAHPPPVIPGFTYVHPCGV